MNQSETAPRSASLLTAFDSLLAAVSAYRNWRAIALMGMTFIASMAVMALFMLLVKALGSPMIAALGSLLSFLVILYGANGVGIMMMREALGQPPCAIGDAVLQSLFTTHRLIAVAVLEGLIVLAAMLAVMLLLFICKLPVLGPFLFTFVFPLSAVFLGMLVFALFYVMFPLAGPAVWLGSNTFQVLARLNLLARRRLLEVVSQQIILFVIVGFISAIIFSMIMLGLSMASGLSVSVVGYSGGAGGLLMGGGMAYLMSHGGAEASSYALAGIVGGSFLFAVAAVIPALIATKGVCLVYLKTSQGLDFTQAEAELQSGMDAVKARAEQARERAAQQMAQQGAAQQAQQPPQPTENPEGKPQAPAPQQAAAAPSCPNCHAPVAADDRFCGECGHKLQ